MLYAGLAIVLAVIAAVAIDIGGSRKGLANTMRWTAIYFVIVNGLILAGLGALQVHSGGGLGFLGTTGAVLLMVWFGGSLTVSIMMWTIKDIGRPALAEADGPQVAAYVAPAATQAQAVQTHEHNEEELRPGAPRRVAPLIGTRSPTRKPEHA